MEKEATVYISYDELIRQEFTGENSVDNMLKELGAPVDNFLRNDLYDDAEKMICAQMESVFEVRIEDRLWMEIVDMEPDDDEVYFFLRVDQSYERVEVNGVEDERLTQLLEDMIPSFYEEVAAEAMCSIRETLDETIAEWKAAMREAGCNV